ncbi:tetratricopeptide repeat protein [Alphaproteobacteria bacterium]|nr:tetratricopeptide repeat protein [Alphaproteobacteria bacterium]
MKCSNAFNVLILLCFLSVSPSFAGNMDKTFADTKKQAEQGDATAQYELGYMYNFGEGVAEDKEAAVKWYRLAADQGDVGAQFNLGVLYFFGEGVAEDKEAAEKWYRLAAEQGYADGQWALGFMYDNGEGVAEDKEAAVKWYRLAAEQGDADAQFSLGVMYDEGEGVAEDNEAAVKWYRLAAEKGNADAQYELANKLDNGGGVPQANPEVETLYKLAAEQGHEGAAYVLKIGQKIGLKEEPILDDLAIKHYNEAGKILLDVINNSGGIAIEHYQKDTPYKKLAHEDKEKLINQIKTCSDYLYFEKWNGNFQPYNTGHPSLATYEILLGISYQELSTNGCRTPENYKILEPKVDYQAVYDLAEKLSEVDKDAVRYVLFNLISKGLIEKPNYSLAYDLVTRKSEGYDSSVLIRWGQRLLAENGANIIIDGDFGPSTCLALNITLGRDKSSVCGNTFQKNDILELVALK